MDCYKQSFFIIKRFYLIKFDISIKKQYNNLLGE